MCLVVCSPSTCQVEATRSLSGIVSLRPTWDIWDSVSKTQNHKEVASGNQGYTFMCKELGLSLAPHQQQKKKSLLLPNCVFLCHLLINMF